MLSQRHLKNKIQAVGNIGQMTRAMELVAATKMRKAQERALEGRPYAMHALTLLSRMIRSASSEAAGSLWQRRAKGKVCFVVVSSDKGLAGSFNGAILKMALKYLEERMKNNEIVELVAVGKKAAAFFKKKNANIAAEFTQFSDVLTLSDAFPLSQWLLHEYEKGTYKEINFCSTIFVSALVQKPHMHPLLPLDSEELEEIVDAIVPQKGRYAELKIERVSENESIAYLLEPSPQAILEELARDLVEVAVLHLLLESNASEHSARMLAMKNASDNAMDLIDTLTLDLNKARQAAITQELTEISTAKEAFTYE
ncbi:MAG: ATP synthase F1 subunit gamma [Candidatus Wildermuthbacteria bacterium]|nr:ATP synthase F1 subunit gamma [Candidatus Wildermuthbacteria bacterium]